MTDKFDEIFKQMDELLQSIETSAFELTEELDSLAKEAVESQEKFRAARKFWTDEEWDDYFAHWADWEVEQGKILDDFINGKEK